MGFPSTPPHPMQGPSADETGEWGLPTEVPGGASTVRATAAATVGPGGAGGGYIGKGTHKNTRQSPNRPYKNPTYYTKPNIPNKASAKAD